jgi:hypothetical protein
MVSVRVSALESLRTGFLSLSLAPPASLGRWMSTDQHLPGLVRTRCCFKALSFKSSDTHVLAFPIHRPCLGVSAKSRSGFSLLSSGDSQCCILLLAYGPFRINCVNIVNPVSRYPAGPEAFIEKT